MQPQQVSDRSQLVFGNITVDLRRRLLLRQGHRVDLAESYWNALILLINSRPDSVSKADLQSVLKLTEASLPKAIELIREALGDVEDPRRFIVTERGVGYRFIAAESSGGSRHYRLLFTIAGGLVLVLAGILLRPAVTPRPKARVFYKITRADRADIPLLTDGHYIYFGQWDNARFSINRALLTGGDPTAIPTSLPNPELCDISPDGQFLLVRSIVPGGFRDNPAPLWIIRVTGEVVGPVGSVDAVDAAWMPDGRRVTFSNGPEISTVGPDGNGRQLLIRMPGDPRVIEWWLRWSQDSKRLRFTVTHPGIRGRTIWEVSASGMNPRPVDGMERFIDACCGSWADRRRYVFGATTPDGATQIWSFDQQSAQLAPDLSPVLAPFGLTSYRGPLISRDGSRLFMRATTAQGEIVRYSHDTGAWTPILRDLSAGMVALSRDGKRAAYTTLPELALWVANADGGGRQQINGSTLQAVMPRWSPAGDQVAFMGRQPGQAWKVYIVKPSEGAPRAVLPNDQSQQADPDWSPSGQQLVFGQNPAQRPDKELPAIFTLDLSSGSISPVPASGQLDSPRWSPDGRYIAAFESGSRRLMVYEFATKKWTAFTENNSSGSGYPSWSSDSNFVYFLSSERKADGTTENIVLRLDVRSRTLLHFASLASIRQGAFIFGTWIGLDNLNAVLAARDLTAQEIDAIDWQ